SFHSNSSLCKKLTGWLFLLILLACNLHLFAGTSPADLIFQKRDVLEGQIYRIVTHPFVHVSWYHLILDAAAVFILWLGMAVSLRWRHLACFFAAAASLGGAVMFSPVIDYYGLCGLSGMAHGLVVFVGMLWFLDNTGDPYQKTLGFIFMISVSLKAIVEVWAGSGVFDYFHLGRLGVPIVHSHLGGVVGGFVAAAAYIASRNFNKGEPNEI
ncbi:MAG: rhombosortase, partial [Desulfocapsaceae bacterium]|nr:rhombosortase [Desulfocapsaceae bacterium]